MLICSKCNQKKDESFFRSRNKDKYRFGKYRSICRDCAKIQQRYAYAKRKQADPFTSRYQKIKGANPSTDLTPEFLKGLWTGKCFISGEPIHFYNTKEVNNHSDGAELDRIIPNIGYMKGNVCWLSREFNCKKSNSSIEDLEKILKWMKNYKPIHDSFSFIQKQKQIPWNRGLKYTNPDAAGDNCSSSKLSSIDVKNIRDGYVPKRGRNVELAKQYGVNRVTIDNIIKGKSWKTIL